MSRRTTTLGRTSITHCIFHRVGRGKAKNSRSFSSTPATTFLSPDQPAKWKVRHSDLDSRLGSSFGFRSHISTRTERTTRSAGGVMSPRPSHIQNATFQRSSSSSMRTRTPFSFAVSPEGQSASTTSDFMMTKSQSCGRRLSRTIILMEVRHWRGTTWGSPLEQYRKEAAVRLRRVGGRPFLVSQNGSTSIVEDFIHSILANSDNFTFSDVSVGEILGELPNDIAKTTHTDAWLVKPSVYRERTWQWINGVLHSSE